MKDFMIIVCVLLAFLIFREVYHLYSMNYASKLKKRFSTIYNSSLIEEEREWIVCHIHYLSLIASDRYQCSILKIRKNFMKDLELGLCCNILTEKIYEDLKAALFSY